MLALLFVTLPFVVRAVQPVLLELDREMEQAATSLGAEQLRRPSGASCCRTCCPAILAGAGLAFARAIGEFGSVVLISGNIPFETEVAVGATSSARSRATTSRPRRPPCRSCCSSISLVVLLVFAGSRALGVAAMTSKFALALAVALGLPARCCSADPGRRSCSSTGRSRTASAPCWDALTTPAALHAF